MFSLTTRALIGDVATLVLSYSDFTPTPTERTFCLELLVGCEELDFVTGSERQ